MITVSCQSTDSFEQQISNGLHHFAADMAANEGGGGEAPTPFDLLYGAWGACTNMTLQVYTRRKGWPLLRVETTLREVEPGVHQILEKKIQVWGDLTAKQVEQLKIVAEKCPVNQFLIKQNRPLQVDSTIELIRN